MPGNSDADKPTNSEHDDTANIFDSDIGDDWGDAFEAEDFMSTPDEESSSEFFLDDADFAGDSSAASSSSDLLTDETLLQASHGIPADATFFQKIILQVQATGSDWKNRFLLLPALYQKCAMAGGAALFLLLIGLLLFSPSPPPPQQVNQTRTAGEGIAGPDLPQNLQGEDPATAQPAPVTEKIRKKWQLPPFLVSASDKADGDDIFFVMADISFILLMDEDEPLPEEKAVFVKNIVYQFFKNRPLYELRRYSLARGELNRKLRAWIEKQWPEAPIDSIVFNRYQVL